MAATSLTYELCVSVMDAFKLAHPDIIRPSLLGLAVTMDGTSPILKISVSEMGMAEFTREVCIPKTFEYVDDSGKKTGFKTILLPVPVIPAPVTGKKTSGTAKQ